MNIRICTDIEEKIFIYLTMRDEPSHILSEVRIHLLDIKK